MEPSQKKAAGKLRFGFLSTAQIGRKNWKAIVHSGNALVTAVASRDSSRAREFISKCQAQSPFETAPAAVESYEKLIASKDVDAVYIPLPTGLRKEWVIRAAESGKHVVCEKPCGLNAADLQEMIAACRKNRVQFMDGVMFMHHPRLAEIRRVLDDGSSVGRIKRIASMFSFHGGEEFLSSNIRTDGGLEPAGSLGDLGWYCIRFILWALNWQLPRRVCGHIVSESPKRGSAAVPMDFSAELVFDGGVSAELFSSFLIANQQWVNVSGSKGYLRVADFVHVPNDLESTFEVNNAAVRVSSAANGESTADRVAQQTLLWRNFANQALSGKLNESWPEMALKTQRVMDACLESARSRHEVVI